MPAHARSTTLAFQTQGWHPPTDLPCSVVAVVGRMKHARSHGHTRGIRLVERPPRAGVEGTAPIGADKLVLLLLCGDCMLAESGAFPAAVLPVLCGASGACMCMTSFVVLCVTLWGCLLQGV